MNLSRRSLFKGVGVLLAAPAIVKVGSLMPIHVLKTPWDELMGDLVAWDIHSYEGYGTLRDIKRVYRPSWLSRPPKLAVATGSNGGGAGHVVLDRPLSGFPAQCSWVGETRSCRADDAEGHLAIRNLYCVPLVRVSGVTDAP